jgi:glycolate oxidase FAD binding subunit
MAMAGSPETVSRQVRDFTAMIEAAGGSALPFSAGQTGPAWHAIRNLLAGAPADPARILCKITVPIARTGDLVAAAGEAGIAAGMPATVLAHSGSGVVWALFLPGSEAVPAEPATRALEGLRAQAQAAGGSLVLQEAPAVLKRQLDAWGAPGDSLDLMRRIKAEFDPRGLCCPGRFLGGI